MKEQNCDRNTFWAALVKQAVWLGITHAEMKQKPFTAQQLFKLLASQYADGISARNGHIVALRTAYGAGYKGVKINQRVLQKAQATVPATNPPSGGNELLIQ